MEGWSPLYAIEQPEEHCSGNIVHILKQLLCGYRGVGTGTFVVTSLQSVLYTCILATKFQ